ncbi:MAG: TIGR03032 family protein, partial [Cyanobacteria bacterium J06560_2]
MSRQPANTSSPPKEASPKLEISASRHFTAWLHEQNISLSFTTYQAGKLFFIGLQSNGKLSIFERTFERSMGLFVQGSTLWLSTIYQLWHFENSLEPGQTYQGYDALYVPQQSYVTGDLDIHDIVIPDGSQDPIFANTLFSCLSTVSTTHSFVPVWHPPFISRLAAEDRCHLNGLALREGQPRYVTTIGKSDVADSWRDHRQAGGCVIDIPSSEIVSTGLSMPHSPRWYRDKLWLLNSGTGEFGHIDLTSGEFTAVTFCPGYLRGLAFAGDFAIVGLSEPRHNKSFQGLQLDQALADKGAKPRCGLGVIDLRSGDLVHTLRIEGVVEELYDVAAIPGVRRPMAIGLRSNEIHRIIS